jgi:hypothetical protein
MELSPSQQPYGRFDVELDAAPRGSEITLASRPSGVDGGPGNRRGPHSASDPNSPQLYDYVAHRRRPQRRDVRTGWSKDTPQIKLALWDSAIYGTGILENIWDNTLSSG